MQACAYAKIAGDLRFISGQCGEMQDHEFVQLAKERMARDRIPQSDLARVLWPNDESADGGQSKVAKILNGRRRLKPGERELIQRYLGIEDDPRAQTIPVIGLASAGAWQEAITLPSSRKLIQTGMAGRRAFGVEIRGDSMNLLLPEGGWAVIDPDQNHLYTGRVYLLENGEHETTIKRYVGEPARFEPVSDNPDHKPILLANVPHRIIGRVVSYGNDQGL